MGEDLGARRPSIATIFNPRRGRGSAPARPSVVVTDEDTPGPPLQLSNGAGVRVSSAGVSAGSAPTPVRSPSINLASPAPPADPETGECTFRKWSRRECVFQILFLDLSLFFVLLNAYYFDHSTF